MRSWSMIPRWVVTMWQFRKYLPYPRRGEPFGLRSESSCMLQLQVLRKRPSGGRLKPTGGGSWVLSRRHWLPSVGGYTASRCTKTVQREPLMTPATRAAPRVWRTSRPQICLEPRQATQHGGRHGGQPCSGSGSPGSIKHGSTGRLVPNAALRGCGATCHVPSRQVLRPKRAWVFGSLNG
jgi:hypothetical protein